MELRTFIRVILAFTLFSLFFPFIRYKIALYRATNRRKTGYPYRAPSKDPFFNIDLILKDFSDKKAHRSREEDLKTFQRFKTKTFESFRRGQRNLHTCDARNVKCCLATDSDKYGVAEHRKPMVPFVGRGTMITDGEAWHASRKSILPTFTRSHIADQEFFEKHYERFLARLPKDGSIVDLKPLFEALGLDASTEFIFGKSFDSQLGGEKYADGRKFLTAFTDAEHVVGARRVFGERLASLLPMGGKREKFNQNCDVFRNYTMQQVEQALHHQRNAETAKDQQETYILLDEIAKHDISKEAICDELLNVFVAGREAPAIVLSNIFYNVVRNPRVWSKMREEAQGLQPSDLSFAKLKNLRYIQHAINEAFRLHPVSPTILRDCYIETQLPHGGGPDGKLPVTVMPGDRVMCSFYSMHQDADVFGPDVEAYRPERWQDLRPGWSFLPFSGGVRHCPGQQLGLFWVSYTLVRMLIEFKEVVNMDPVAEYRESIRIVCESENGNPVKLVRA